MSSFVGFKQVMSGEKMSLVSMYTEPIGFDL